MVHQIEHGAALVALGGAALIGYAVSLYLWPWRPHGACNGTGRRKGSNARRSGPCKGCHGGQVQRFGSRTVHRLAWAIRGELGRRRARRLAARAADRSAHPRDIADRKYPH